MQKYLEIKQSSPVNFRNVKAIGICSRSCLEEEKKKKKKKKKRKTHGGGQLEALSERNTMQASVSLQLARAEATKEYPFDCDPAILVMVTLGYIMTNVSHCTSLTAEEVLASKAVTVVEYPYANTILPYGVKTGSTDNCKPEDNMWWEKPAEKSSRIKASMTKDMEV
ncbi:hypothetical protein llap_10838 [Limosa lapponica baueri]|uniref:Uncharacterized protein n=1 Tax=Limosa lapponica baueri TaxID=1758121 RepID=A0A2I0TYH0_LIMLA|nr:hypothetical protein llap_10838 [Limosa lapponica baueri]